MPEINALCCEGSGLWQLAERGGRSAANWQPQRELVDHSVYKNRTEKYCFAALQRLMRFYVFFSLSLSLPRCLSLSTLQPEERRWLMFNLLKLILIHPAK